MKRKILALLLCVLLLGLTGCSLFRANLKPLYGAWTLTEYFQPETAEEILVNLDFYDSEIALADLEHFGVVKRATFHENLVYTLQYDHDATFALVRAYFDGLLTTLYEHRTELTGDYGEGILDLTQEEFRDHYADMFGQESYDALLDLLAEHSFDYTVLDTVSEAGTYRAGAANEIYCRIDGEGEEESLVFTVDGDTLTLIYTDAEEVYTRN